MRCLQTRTVEFGCKRFCSCQVFEIPTKEAGVIFSPTTAETRPYASHLVKIVHGVQLRAKATGWHGDLDYVREFPLSGFKAGAAFVARHSTVKLAPRAIRVTPHDHQSRDPPLAAQTGLSRRRSFLCSIHILPASFGCNVTARAATQTPFNSATAISAGFGDCLCAVRVAA